MKQRTCPACGLAFTPTNPAQKYCPPTLDDRRRKRRSRCAKRAGNLQQRGGDVTRLHDRPLPAPFTCERCGSQCTPGRDGIAPHATRFCGYECRAAWHKEHVERPKLQAEAARRRWDEALEAERDRPTPDPLQPPDATYTAKFEAITLPRDPCSYCGNLATGVDHIEPTSIGGADGWSNYTACCNRCNGRKSKTPLLIFLGWDQAEREYTPWRTAVGSLYR